MAAYTPNVDDLAIFFLDNDGQATGTWVSYNDYTATALPGLQPGWASADLYEQGLDAGGVCYVANLAKLLYPAQPAKIAHPARLAAQAEAGKGPASNDLVVIPYDNAGKAYLVPRAVYTACPVVQGPSTSTILGMALSLGVVFANLPKSTNSIGWSCYLLSLISLRSGARQAPDSTTNKIDFFAKLRTKNPLQ
jgi:hypothetical protein